MNVGQRTSHNVRGPGNKMCQEKESVMNNLLKRLWLEEDGVVLSSEMMLYGSLGVVGAGAGYTALRDSVNAELSDLAKALGSIDPKFLVRPGRRP